ncbi:hypothetical protein [Epibacterium ulvae]|uniref:hypothetical protein n=1 Tax=Epibacterium ulvae TaxID=1156985 RepID=UPI002491DF7F|nr:hypothetical protein [Epibacterium ulvae]
MKALVLGGSGVFGSRLAQLLVRDQHEVTIAGRKKGALDAYAAELGCVAKQMDRTGDLSALGDYDVVVDAGGQGQEVRQGFKITVPDTLLFPAPVTQIASLKGLSLRRAAVCLLFPEYWRSQSGLRAEVSQMLPQ